MSLPLIILGLLILWGFNSIRILREYERAVIFRVGRVLHEAKGPGFVFVFWPIDQARIVNMQLVTLDVPPQDIITKDNVSAKVNAVAYFKVMDPVKAVIYKETN